MKEILTTLPAFSLAFEKTVDTISPRQAQRWTSDVNLQQTPKKYFSKEGGIQLFFYKREKQHFSLISSKTYKKNRPQSLRGVCSVAWRNPNFIYQTTEAATLNLSRSRLFYLADIRNNKMFLELAASRKEALNCS